jgi:DNA-binding transcriptional LysR family regulator
VIVIVGTKLWVGNSLERRVRRSFVLGANLAGEPIDVIVQISPLHESDMMSRRIMTFELWPCASALYLASAPVIDAPSDLLSHKLIAHSHEREVWNLYDRTGEVQEVRLLDAQVISEPIAQKVMLISGVGIGLLPDFYAADAIAKGQLIHILPACSGAWSICMRSILYTEICRRR